MHWQHRGGVVPGVPAWGEAEGECTGNTGGGWSLVFLRGERLKVNALAGRGYFGTVDNVLS